MLIKNIIFAGTPMIAANTLEVLINAKFNILACYTQPDRLKGRGQKTIDLPVKSVALQHNIPVFQPETLKDPKVINELQQLNPDLIIVFAYGLIFPKTVLNIPKFGCINIHASLLPRWRGAAPIQHAILAGDNITGISIMNMEVGLDTGAVFYKIDCPIINTDTSESLSNKLLPLAGEAILEVLSQLNNHKATLTPQDNKLATIAPKINKNDAKINWQKSAIEIHRTIRAFIPAPIAFTEMPNKDLVRIWQASIVEDDQHSSLTNTLSPGTVLSINKEGIIVLTGNGMLRLEKLQFPGSKILTAIDLFNSPKYRQQFIPQKTQFY